MRKSIAPGSGTSRTPSSLSERHGLLRRRGSLLVGAVIAAHGASEPSAGFRMTDVRFFFYLFSNWLEHDLLQATEPLELTQVRRLMARLVERGWARAPRRRGRAARTRFTLTASGLTAMVGLLASDAERRTFEEALFVVCFAASYGPAIASRAAPEARREVARRLDVQRLLRAEQKRLDRIIDDLEERVRSSREMHDDAAIRHLAGETDAAIAAALDRRGAYQLQHVRSFREVMMTLPPDLLRFEIREGLAKRARLLFTPMLEEARAQRKILSSLRGDP
jgi:hypothetical protein